MCDGDTETTLLFNIVGEEAMMAFGASIAQAIRPRTMITLQGDLGAGKTTLSRGLLQQLGHKGSVKSPTYTLVEPYDLELGRVYHFDLYRVIDPEELEYIGFSDYLSDSSCTLIEWPERGQGYLNSIDIRITICRVELARHISVVADSVNGKDILCRLKTIMGINI